MIAQFSIKTKQASLLPALNKKGKLLFRTTDGDFVSASAAQIEQALGYRLEASMLPLLRNCEIQYEEAVVRNGQQYRWNSRSEEVQVCTSPNGLIIRSLVGIVVASNGYDHLVKYGTPVLDLSLLKAVGSTSEVPEEGSEEDPEDSKDEAAPADPFAGSTSTPAATARRSRKAS